MSKKIFYLFYIDKEKMGNSRKLEPTEILENIRTKLKLDKNIKFINNNDIVKEEEEKKLSINDISIKHNENSHIVYLKSITYHIFKNYKYIKDYSGSKEDLLTDIRKNIELDDECYFLLDNGFEVDLGDEKDTKLSEILINNKIYLKEKNYKSNTTKQTIFVDSTDHQLEIECNLEYKISELRKNLKNKMNNEEFIFLNDNFEEGNEIEKNKESTSYIYSLIDKNNAIYIKKDISKEDIIKENNIPEELELIDFDVDIYINSKLLKSTKIESSKQNLTNLRNKLELSKTTFFFY
jgi:hypothetical protein